MLSMFEMLLPLVAVCFVVGPLWFFFKKGVNQTNAKYSSNSLLFLQRTVK